MCRDAILPMPALCEVPCSKDCVLSSWTSWSLCSHTCSGKNTEGKQTRSRSILAYNAGDGRCHSSICLLSCSLFNLYLTASTSQQNSFNDLWQRFYKSFELYQSENTVHLKDILLLGWDLLNMKDIAYNLHFSNFVLIMDALLMIYSDSFF